MQIQENLQQECDKLKKTLLKKSQNKKIQQLQEKLREITE